MLNCIAISVRIVVTVVLLLLIYNSSTIGKFNSGSTHFKDKLGCDCGSGKYGVRKMSVGRGLKSSGVNRIVNGYEPNHRPWMVYLEICRKDMITTNCGKCGGLILNHRWIVSAAHCFCDKSKNGEPGCKRVGSKRKKRVNVNFNYKKKVTAVLGLSDLEARPRHKEKHFKITRIVINPKYRPKHKFHQHADLALLRTKERINFHKTNPEFNDFGIEPICMPRGRRFRDEDAVSDAVFVAGWGAKADKECNTNSKGPSPYTKCKFPFEHNGEVFHGCLMGFTPSFYDEECKNLKRNKNLKDLPPSNYSRVDVKTPKDETITRCYHYIAMHSGWCGTCIPEAKKPGDKGYCQRTSLDPNPLASLDNYTGESIDEVRVLADKGKLSSHWGICSKYCRFPYLPNMLQEAKLHLVPGSRCKKLVPKLNVNTKLEICAAKLQYPKIRLYQKSSKTKYEKLSDEQEEIFGEVDACFGDSGICYAY